MHRIVFFIFDNPHWHDDQDASVTMPFTSLVLLSSGHYYEFFFTGTTPQKLRLHLLNSLDSQAVVLAIWYAQSWRLDVNINGTYMLPQNGARNPAGRIVLSAPTSPTHYIPDVNTAATGVNYYERDTGLLHIVVRGPGPVDITTAPLIVVSFSMPAMTEAEFFGKNIVNNLALFLNIPPEKILIASSVRQARRRRRAGTMIVSIEIGNSPGAPSVNDLSLQSLQQLSSTIVTAYQMNTLGGVMNVTILTMDLTQPPPAPGSVEWTAMVTGSPALLKPIIIGSLTVKTQPSNASEATAFGVQPIIGFLDPSVCTSFYFATAVQ